MSELRFHLVLVGHPFTRSLPAILEDSMVETHRSFSLLLSTWFDVFFTEILLLERQLHFDF